MMRQDENDASTPDAEADPLELLLAQILERHEADGAAAIVAACREHEQEAERLLARFARLRETGLVGDLAPGERRFARYVVERRLGGGGMGEVFLAHRDIEPGQVALKLLRPELLWFSGFRERFAREIDAIASLDHPSIVRVVASGLDEGIPWYAMEVAAGAPLSAILGGLDGRHPEAVTGEDVVRIVAESGHGPLTAPVPSMFSEGLVGFAVTVARDTACALAHAHGRGVVHRDVKPSNIIVTPTGGVKIVDFGLARREGTSRLTGTLHHVGSLPWMAPERLDGPPAEFDPRADVYSLGVVLHQCLTLRHPFHAESEEETRRLVLMGLERGPAAENPTVNTDLDAVCLRATERDPGRRYATIAEFLDDLENVVARRPVAARPASVWRRIALRARRRPVLTTLLLSIAVLVLALPPALYFRERSHARDLEAALSREEVSRLVAEAIARIQTDPHGARLLALRGASVHRDLVPPELLFELELRDRLLYRTEIDSGRAEDIMFDVDGRLLVATTRGLSSADGSTDAPPSFGGVRAAKLASLPDGSALVADVSGALWVMDAGGVRRTVETGVAKARTLAVSPDGRSAAICGPEGRAALVDLEPPHASRRLVGHEDIVYDVAFSPDGRRVVTASEDRTARVFSVASGACELVLEGAPSFWGAVWSAEFDPSGRRIAVASCDRTVRIHDATTGALLQVLRGHEREVLDVCHSPGGEILASGSYDGTIRLWDASSGDALAVLRGHDAEVWNVRFSPDGNTLASTSFDGTVGVWDVSSRRLAWRLPTHVQPPMTTAFTLDSGRLAVAGRGREVSIFLAHDDRDWIAHGAPVTALAVSPDEKWIASGAEDGTLVLAERIGGRVVARPIVAQEAITAVAVDAASGLLAWGTRGGKGGVFEIATSRVLSTFADHAPWVEVIRFVDGVGLVTFGLDAVRIRDPMDVAVVKRTLRPRDGVTFQESPRLSTDGRRVAMREAPGRRTVLCDVGDGSTVIESSSRLTDVVPDGEAFLVTDRDEVPRLLTRAGERVLPWPSEHRPVVIGVAGSSLRPTVAIADEAGTVWFWPDARSGDPSRIAALIGHDLVALRVLCEGERLLTFERDGRMSLLDSRSGRLLARPGRHAERTSAWIVIGEAGELLVGSVAGRLRRYPLR